MGMTRTVSIALACLKKSMPSAMFVRKFSWSSIIWRSAHAQADVRTSDLHTHNVLMEAFPMYLLDHGLDV
jgi:hypothetical protein